MVACAGRQSCSLKKRIAMDNLFKIFKCWSHDIVSQPKTSQNRTFLVYTVVDESALVCTVLGFHRSHALFLLNCLFVCRGAAHETETVPFTHTKKNNLVLKLTLRSKQAFLRVGLRNSKTHIIIPYILSPTQEIHMATPMRG